MKIAVVGTGYVGLVSGTCFAETGNSVTCIDINTEKVENMKKGIIPIYEPGLEDLFKRNIEEGRLFFSTNLSEGIKGAEIIFLALPTPSGEDGSADLSYIMNVAEQLGELLEQYAVIVDKSTVPVGTSEKVEVAIAKKCKVEFDVVSNPEFLREGVAVDDFMRPDRIVIGTSSDRAKKVMEKLYAPFVRQGNPIFIMDEKSAELTKYAANAFLAMKISFMNEIANLAEIVGADVDKIRKGIGSDSRIGKQFLYAGTGYGGSCFPKDVKALAKTSEDHKFDFKILKSVMEVNKKQKTILLPKIKKYFNNDLKGKTIAIWGLAFKPNTDDIREASALDIIEELLQEGASIKAFDPEAMDNVRKQLGDKITLTIKSYNALEGADALIIATEWNEFRQPDFERIGKLLKNKAIFDGRNLFEVEQMKEMGYHYESIGRKPSIIK